MTRQSAVVKREKSLAEQIIVILIFSVFMSIFIRYFLKNEQNFTNAGFSNIAASFAGQLSVIRGQWFMNNQPQQLRLDETDNVGQSLPKRLVNVNINGWVDSTQRNGLACQKIWQMVMNTPLMFMNKPISAIEINHQMQDLSGKLNSVKIIRGCRYALSSQQYFDYFPEHGTVSNDQK